MFFHFTFAGHSLPCRCVWSSFTWHSLVTWLSDLSYLVDTMSQCEFVVILALPCRHWRIGAAKLAGLSCSRVERGRVGCRSHVVRQSTQRQGHAQARASRRQLQHHKCGSAAIVRTFGNLVMRNGHNIKQFEIGINQERRLAWHSLSLDSWAGPSYFVL